MKKYRLPIILVLIISSFYTASLSSAQCAGRNKCEGYNYCVWVADGGCSDQCYSGADCSEPDPVSLNPASCNTGQVPLSWTQLGSSRMGFIWEGSGYAVIRNGTEISPVNAYGNRLLDPSTRNWIDPSPVGGTSSYYIRAQNYWGSNSSNVVGVTCDQTPPSVTWNSPVSGAVMRIPTVLSVSASDVGSGMNRVEFLLDGSIIKTISSGGPVYSYVWDSASTANGNHSLSARGYDNFGNQTTTSGTTVSVQHTADSCTVNYNSSAYLFWYSSSASSCTVYNQTAGDTVVATGQLYHGYPGLDTTPLTSSTTYRIDCTDGTNSVSDSSTITVIPPSPPTVTTDAASDVSYLSATLNGSANPNGGATDGWFRYSTTNPGTCNDIFGTRIPGVSGTALGSGTSPVAFSNATSNVLNQATTYYYCAIASNNSGFGYGNIISFTTSSAPPTVSNATVTVSNSNYCAVGPHATITWTYSDPLGFPQGAYEALINGGADINTTPDTAITGLNPSNINPEWRGTGAGGSSSGPSSGCSSSNADADPQITCQLTWNTDYTAWVRVQNSSGIWSSWIRMSEYVNGANPPSAQTSWTTPTQAFPQVSFTTSPASPAKDTPVIFTDTTVFQGAATPRTWLWDFNYPSGPTQTITAPTATNGNATYTYTSTGTFTPRLTATDNLGQSCSYDLSPAISIQAALPNWREVAPR